MMKKYVFMVVLGVITFGFSTQSFSKVRKIKKVNDVTTVTEVESKTAVEVKEKLKVSVGVQQVNAITEDKQNIFNITQRTLNVSTFYQWDPKTTFSILIPYHMETGENTLPTVTDEAKIIEHKYFGRVEVGAQQELFSHSNIGTVSGMVNLALPTMSGFSQKLGYEYFKAFIYFKSYSEKEVKSFVEYASQNPNVVYVIFQLSSWDLEIEIAVRNYPEFNAVMNDFREKFPELIKSYESILMIEDCFHSGMLV